MICLIPNWIINHFVFSESAVFDKVSTAIKIMKHMLNGPWKCPECRLTLSLRGAIILLQLNHVLIFGRDTCEHAWLKTLFFVYFLSACVLMRTWWLAVMSSTCQLINYTLATEENICHAWVCTFWNPFPITWNEFYHNIQPNNFEYSHKVHFSKSFFSGKISTILPICIMKKKINLMFRFDGIVSVTGTLVNIYQIW